MVCGVGSPKTLERHNFEVLKDLPVVGQNLQDQVISSHLTTSISLRTDSAAPINPALTAAAIEAYIKAAAGSLNLIFGWRTSPMPPSRAT